MNRLELYALAAALIVLTAAIPAGLIRLVWQRPRLTWAVLAGTVLSLLIVVPWSFLASLTIGPSGPIGFRFGDLPGSYVRLAAGPAGDPAGLAGLVITLVTAFCVLAGWRSRPVTPRSDDQ